MYSIGALIPIFCRLAKLYARIYTLWQLCFLAVWASVTWANPPLSPSKPADQKDRVLQIDITAQPLTQTLNALSHYFNVSFAAPSDLIDDISATTIKGQFNLNQALAVLEESAPLKFIQLGNGFIVKYNEKNVGEPRMEEMVTRGIRQSFISTRDIKRNAIDIIDALDTKDFSRYPNLNIAESLNKIPGLTLTREAGEGRQVSMRGISPEFSLVTLNGMPVLANSDSPMDSRGQKKRDRSFDFNIFSSDLFNQVYAVKSYSAENLPGGIAGTLAMKTFHPFQQPGLHASASYQQGDNNDTDKLSTRTSGQISNTGKNWGGLISYTYSLGQTQEQGANTFRWRNIQINDAILDDLNKATQEGLRNGEYIVPRGNRYSVWKNTQQRIGIGSAIQFNSDRHKINADILYAQLNGDRNEYHLYPRGSQSTPIIADETRITEAVINEDNELIFARYKNARVAVESRQQNVSTHYKQAVINAEHKLSPLTQVNWLLGRETSNFEIPQSNKAYMQSRSDISIDYRKDRFYADIIYENSDLMDLNNFRMSEIDQEYYLAQTQFDNMRISINIDTPKISWLSGFDYGHFSSSALSLFNSNLLKDEWSLYEQSENNNSGIDNHVPAHLTEHMFNHHKQNWLVLDTNSTLEYFNINKKLLSNSDGYTTSRLEGQLDERSQSIFILGQYRSDEISTKAALRYYKNTTQIYYGIDKNNRKNWAKILPSINTSWQVNHNFSAKLSLSKNISKPHLSDLLTIPSYNTDDFIVYSDNSHLRPYTSKNIDLSLTFYWSNNDLFSLSLFQKKIKDYIISQSTDMYFINTSVYDHWESKPFADNDKVKFVKKENAESADLHGIETQIKHQFSYLPEPFNNFGIDFQAAFISGEVAYYNENTGAKLFTKDTPYLSKKSGALSLYYQSKKMHCRLTSNYRDKYIYRVSSEVLSDEDETGFHASLYIDALLTYQLTKQWQLKVQAFNLSNQRQEQYSDSSDRPYNTTISGTSLYLGLSFHY